MINHFCAIDGLPANQIWVRFQIPNKSEFLNAFYFFLVTKSKRCKSTKWAFKLPCKKHHPRSYRPVSKNGQIAFRRKKKREKWMFYLEMVWTFQKSAFRQHLLPLFLLLIALVDWKSAIFAKNPCKSPVFKTFKILKMSNYFKIF